MDFEKLRVGFTLCQATGHSKTQMGRVRCLAPAPPIVQESQGTHTVVEGATLLQVMATILEMLSRQGPRRQPAVRQWQLWPPCLRPGAVLLL